MGEATSIECGTVADIEHLRAVRRLEDAFESPDLLDTADPRTRALLGRRSNRRRAWLVHRSLVAADLVSLAVAFVVAQVIFGLEGAGEFGVAGEYALFALTLPAWVLVARLHGLYDRDLECADHTTTDDVVGVIHLVTIGAWLLFAAGFLAGVAKPEPIKLIAFWLLAICFMSLARTIARIGYRRSDGFQQNTVILGAGDVGQLIARKILKHPEYGINLVGFVDEFPRRRRADLPEHLTILGGPERLTEIIGKLQVERVVLSFWHGSESELLELIRQLHRVGVQIDLVPRLFELMTPRVSVHTVESLPLIGLPPIRMTPSSRLLKRAIDVLGAGTALLVTAPVFAYIAIRIRLDSAGPVLFRQSRLGMGMREFTALKFRTMRVDTDAAAHRAYVEKIMSPHAEAGSSGIYKLDRSDAITKIGRWLRKTSLDELPQLINVLRGDMSLVGPRPCIPYETEHFKPHQFERFLLPQGITGLWQVTARANSTYGEALDMDVAYVRGWSLGLDLRLMLRTPLALVRQRRATS